MGSSPISGIIFLVYSIISVSYTHLAAGCGVLMGNAPAAIRETFPGKVTLDNNHDGIPVALKDLGMI